MYMNKYLFCLCFFLNTALSSEEDINTGHLYYYEYEEEQIASLLKSETAKIWSNCFHNKDIPEEQIEKDEANQTNEYGE